MLTSPALVATLVPTASAVLAATAGSIAWSEWRLRRMIARGARHAEAAAAIPSPAPAPPPGQPEPPGVPPTAAAGPGGSPGHESRPHGGAPPARAPAPPARPPLVFMGPGEQMADFMRWVIADDFCGEHTAQQWLAYYRDWASACRIKALTDADFLRRLAKVETVVKARPRLLDRDGRVLKTDGGTDIRATTYNFPKPAGIGAVPGTAAPRRKSPRPTAIPATMIGMAA